VVKGVTMAKAVVVLAEGFEEIEAVTVIDVLRRAGVQVSIAGLERGAVRGSHDIGIVAEQAIEATSAADFDALILPGGMPGAARLRDDKRVQGLIQAFAKAGKLCAAICAAPIALEAAGVLSGRRATSYPGFELPSASYVEDKVVIDGNLVTSRGVGTALEFALSLVERLATPEKAAELRQRMLVG
jgi:4-methyl-5(b-hydroxyethyl)-thiazole monophosphate biosynthesis